ncbi:MAG: metallophosphoesterase [Nitrospirae bacterium]|nr:metallophosphoesterase [Nitrospirota bacterium]
MSRTIVIGDVHGCYREWVELLRVLEVKPEDRLISVGDLICKGPDSHAVLESAIALPNLECILGNHETRFLGYWKNGGKEFSKPYDKEAMEQLKPDFERYMKFVSKWKWYVELDGATTAKPSRDGPDAPKREDMIVVHAGVRNGIALEKQTLEDLTTLKRLPPDNHPWYDDYKGTKTIVFGHYPQREPLVRDRLIGLDTGCVYGGTLTALVLPGRKIVSVPAEKAYYKKSRS